MIKVENISKNFGKKNVLNNISFDVSCGEIIGFLGPNGAGKTTLMRILTTYLLPTKGTFFIKEKDARTNSMFIRKSIGYLPETPPLYENMTVNGYLKYAAALKDVKHSLIEKEINRLLEECNLTDVGNKLIMNLSKGYKQRVGIAQSLINDPDILILDEPTNGLDPIQIQSIRNLIDRLKTNKTIILSTHILSEIEKMADRVLMIRSGNIILDGRLADLLRDGNNKTLEDLFIETIKDEENT